MADRLCIKQTQDELATSVGALRSVSVPQHVVLAGPHETVDGPQDQLQGNVSGE